MDFVQSKMRLISMNKMLHFRFEFNLLIPLESTPTIECMKDIIRFGRLAYAHATNETMRVKSVAELLFPACMDTLIHETP